nr:universal stress protein [Antrihabitans stalactiti]
MVHPLQKSIVVGIDGSAAAVHAAEWAATDAVARDLPLTLVYVAAPDSEEPVTNAPQTEFDYGRAALHTARQAAERRAEGLKVDLELVRGDIDSTLTDLSANADMVVVGSVGIGFFAEMILGSTASTLARTAQCTVAIIRPPHRYAAVPIAGPIVVLVDGHSYLSAVLGAAFFEGSIRGAEVMVPQTRRNRPWAVPASSTTVERGAMAPVQTEMDVLRRQFPEVVSHSMIIEGYPIAYLRAVEQERSAGHRGSREVPLRIGCQARLHGARDGVPREVPCARRSGHRLISKAAETRLVSSPAGFLIAAPQYF